MVPVAIFSVAGCVGRTLVDIYPKKSCVQHLLPVIFLFEACIKHSERTVLSPNRALRVSDRGVFPKNSTLGVFYAGFEEEKCGQQGLDTRFYRKVLFKRVCFTRCEQKNGGWRYADTHTFIIIYIGRGVTGVARAADR